MSDKRQPDEVFTLMADVSHRKVGCVLIQAMHGCSGLYELGVGAETWLTFPTPGMQRITGTRQEWQRFLEQSSGGAK